MFAKTLTSLLVLASAATAHFTIAYPEMRGANVNQTAATNRTLWPLTGGSLNLDLHHPWTYIFANLGLGTDYPTFNITLTNPFLNSTGNGTLCLPEIKLPAGVSVSDGQNASLQVVTIGASGSALYNCADITFSSRATLLSGSNCTNSPGITSSVVNQEVNGSTTSTSSAANSSSTKTSSGSTVGTSSSMFVSGVATGLGFLVMIWLL
ncbi:hypothetical protein G7Y89_g13676 [Cudoniella acicularis]|uniref:Copper acquisition factor BIM1-like domain-containing protein n=1 Tax=Cudoniella acicularis TaxID=354080 RepID=A0A8H4VY05_9HELO|nr:hypothetical protein G7Y89_g13676 [Cudoniella acicularis]